MDKRKPVILAVDDDETLLRTIHDALTADGFRVITAADGISAVFQLARRNPDLIILDIMMPEFDGFQTLEMIRRHSEVPVIMLTCLDDRSSLHRSLDEGKADGYITKPFSLKYLTAQIKAKLRRTDHFHHSPHFGFSEANKIEETTVIECEG